MTGIAEAPSDSSAVAVSALDPSSRVLMACAGPSDTRTQGGQRSIATRPTEDTVARSVPAAASSTRGRGERAPGGGKRGMVEMSSGFCAHPRAIVRLKAHNGLTHNTTLIVKAAACGKSSKRHLKRGHQ
jgi:hypothetical protein